MSQHREKQDTIFTEEEHENEHWSQVFQRELEHPNDGEYATAWWEDCYQELVTVVDSHISQQDMHAVLEAGCGSGKATLLLKTPFQRIVLLDFSDAALQYARYLGERYEKKNVETICANIFSLPFQDQTFQFTWNTGVLEHYDPKQIIALLMEMLRVTTDNGWIGFGVPNKKSLPIIKAKILGHRFWGIFFPFIKGYRLDSEKFYSNSELASFLDIAASRMGIKIQSLRIHWVGNPLFVGTPGWLIRMTNLIAKYIPQRKFLILFMAKISRKK